MKARQSPASISPECMAALQETAERAAKGSRDPEEARQAAEETDRLREVNRRRFGVQAVGVDIIREFRGPLPE